MVLVVVCDESDLVTLNLSFSAEESLVEWGHFLEVAGAQDHMCQPRGRPDERSFLGSVGHVEIYDSYFREIEMKDRLVGICKAQRWFAIYIFAGVLAASIKYGPKWDIFHEVHVNEPCPYFFP